jgi:hypothetical protein
VTYRIGTQLRRLVWPTIWLALAIASVCTPVVVFAAGAHRTATIPQRVEAAIGGGFDAIVSQEEGGRPITDDVLALPAVESGESFTFVFGGVAPVDTSEFVEGLLFAGSPGAFGSRIVDGRAADPTGDDEFVASPTFIDATGAQLGDRFDVFTLSQEQADAGLFGAPEMPLAKTLTATLVGTIDGPGLVEDPTPFALVAAPLVANEAVGVSVTKISVRLAPGADLDDLRSQLDGLASGAQLSIAPADLIQIATKRAITTQSRGMWLLALLSGIAGTIALSQLISRHVRLSANERSTLRALGFTNGQPLAESLIRSSVPIGLGCCLAMLLAIPFSTIFPTGSLGLFEPDPGILVDAGVLVLTGLLLMVALLGCTTLLLAAARRQSRVNVAAPLVDSVARRVSSPAPAIGIRFGFSSAGAERGSARGTLTGVAVAACGLAAALTFGLSLGRLIDDPDRYGSTGDLLVGDSGGDQIDPGLVAELEADSTITSLVYYAQAYARVGDTTVPVLGMRVVRGGSTPPVLAGRLPSAEDEVAFGRVSGRAAAVGVGDAVELIGTAGTKAFRVVGLVVLPGFGSNEGVGEGALTTLDGFSAISAAQVTNAVVDYRSGPDVAPPYLTGSGASIDDPFVPAAIASLTRVRAIPFVLAGVLALLLVLTVAHGLLVSIRARRHDLAVLRALGADGGLVGRAVHWQATAVTVVPAALGVPIGIIVGRVIFVAFAENIGAIDEAAYPLLLVTATLLGLAVLANAVALWPSRSARRVAPATALRIE